VIPVWFNGRDPCLEAMAVAQAHQLAVVRGRGLCTGITPPGTTRWHLWRSGLHLLQHHQNHHDRHWRHDRDRRSCAARAHRAIEEPRPAGSARLSSHDWLQNFGFSDLLAALGLAQMRKLPARVAHKQLLCRWYQQRLARQPGLDLLPLSHESCLWYPDIFVDDPPR